MKEARVVRVSVHTGERKTMPPPPRLLNSTDHYWYRLQRENEPNYPVKKEEVEG